MKTLLMKSVVISLIIVLLGIVSIIQINNEFTTNVTIQTRVSSETIRSVNSLGILAAFFIVACLLLFAFSFNKKKAKKTRKLKQVKRKAAKRKK